MPKLPGFCGGSYQSRSIIADCQRCVNLYPEQSGEKNNLVLVGTPGRTLFSALGDYPPRCACLTRGRLFILSGATLYELDNVGTATVRGIVSGYGTATISSNGIELYITSGNASYLYTLSTNTLIVLTNPGSFQGVFWDGYFVGLEPGTQTLTW
jgi:hypothetical protein